MENKNTITGFEFLYTVATGYDQYYEGYTITTAFESDIEIGDTTIEDTIIQAMDVDNYTVKKIIDKLNSENFYPNFLEELRAYHLPDIPADTKYSITIALGCRSEHHNLDDVTTQSIIELHQYLKKTFNVK